MALLGVFSSSMKTLVLMAALIAVSPVALGELAPEVYQAMQQAAPEVLQLEILSVEIDRDFHKPDGCGFFEFEITRNVVVEAKVLSVVRSRIGIRPGAVLRIPYTSVKRCEGFSGPRSLLLLSEKDRVYAYLAKTERGLAPAARGASFTR